MSAPHAERTIFLVNPHTPTRDNSNLGQYRMGVPAGLGVVGSMMENIRDENSFPADEVGIRVIDENLRQTADPQPGDLVLASAFSLYTRSVQTLIRKVNEQGGLVVVGGVHATVAPDDFSKKGAISFMGEAGNSIVFSDLMNQWLHGGELGQGQNIKSEGLANPKAIDLDNLPVSEKIYRALDENTIIRTTFATVGCPYNCEFCTVMAGRVVRKRPVEEIVAEIQLRGLDKSGFALADSNLGAGGDKYLYRLLDEFSQVDIPRGWTSEISINLLDRGGENLLDALKKAQCHRLFVGIESPSAENLNSVGKKHNLDYNAQKVSEMVGKAHKRGIKITGLFIVGFPTETIKSIRSIEQYIKDTHLDGANIFILTPLPGTEIWDRFTKEELFDPQTLDTDELDLRHLLFKHPLGNDNLLREYEQLCRQVFSGPAVISRGMRAFFRSWSHQLPKNLQQAAYSSVVAEMLQADYHRRLGLVDTANKVYETWRRLTSSCPQ